MKLSKGLEKNPTGKRLYEMNSKKIFLKNMFLSNNRKLYSFIDSKVTQNILKLFS